MARLAYFRDTSLDQRDMAAFATASSENFFAGELRIGSSLRDARVKLEVTSARDVKIIAFDTAIQQSYRRTGEHIKADAVDLYLLWIITSGILDTRQAHASASCSGPALTVTRSDQPFLQTAGPFALRDFVAKIALIPGHLFRAHVSAPQGFLGKPVTIAHGAGKAVRTVVDLLYDEADTLPSGVCTGLMQQCLSLLNEISRSNSLGLAPPVSIASRRANDVFSTIEGLLFEPGLNPQMVAQRCGISRGYLHRIFAQTGTKFSHHLERRRLEIARQWLLDPEMGKHTVGQISTLAGFSCPSHFSRSFRRTFGDTPSSLRSGRQRSGPQGSLARRRT